MMHLVSHPLVPVLLRRRRTNASCSTAQAASTGTDSEDATPRSKGYLADPSESGWLQGAPDGGDSDGSIAEGVRPTCTGVLIQHLHTNALVLE